MLRWKGCQMQTLLERIEAVRGYAADLNTVETERARFLQIRTRAGQLRVSADALGALTSSLGALRSAGISAPIPKLSRELRTKPAAMLESFRKDPASFLDDGQFAVTFKAPLEAYATK